MAVGALGPLEADAQRVRRALGVVGVGDALLLAADRVVEDLAKQARDVVGIEPGGLAGRWMKIRLYFRNWPFR